MGNIAVWKTHKRLSQRLAANVEKLHPLKPEQTNMAELKRDKNGSDDQLVEFWVMSFLVQTEKRYSERLGPERTTAKHTQHEEVTLTLKIRDRFSKLQKENDNFEPMRTEKNKKTQCPFMTKGHRSTGAIKWAKSWITRMNEGQAN